MKILPTCTIHPTPRPRWCQDCARDEEKAGTIQLQPEDIGTLERRHDSHTGLVSFRVTPGRSLERPNTGNPWF